MHLDRGRVERRSFLQRDRIDQPEVHEHRPVRSGSLLPRHDDGPPVVYLIDRRIGREIRAVLLDNDNAFVPAVNRLRAVGIAKLVPVGIGLRHVPVGHLRHDVVSELCGVRRVSFPPQHVLPERGAQRGVLHIRRHHRHDGLGLGGAVGAHVDHHRDEPDRRRQSLDGVSQADVHGQRRAKADNQPLARAQRPMQFALRHRPHLGVLLDKAGIGQGRNARCRCLPASKRPHQRIAGRPADLRLLVCC